VGNWGTGVKGCCEAAKHTGPPPPVSENQNMLPRRGEKKEDTGHRQRKRRDLRPPAYAGTHANGTGGRERELLTLLEHVLGATPSGNPEAGSQTTKVHPGEPTHTPADHSSPSGAGKSQSCRRAAAPPRTEREARTDNGDTHRELAQGPFPSRSSKQAQRDGAGAGSAAARSRQRPRRREIPVSPAPAFPLDSGKSTS